MTLPFLLEIGTEEIPDWMIKNALEDLREKFVALGIPHETVQVDATPRRLVLRASGLPVGQADSEELVFGPSEGAPEQAVEGFARKHGVSRSDLGLRSKSMGQSGSVSGSGGQSHSRSGSGGKSHSVSGSAGQSHSTSGSQYHSFTRRVAGRTTAEMLAAALPGIVLGIYFPKTMYWTAKNGPRFIRPIRWLVALLGGDVVPFEIGGVRSGNVSSGHRRLGAAEVAVTCADYEQRLRENCVILSADERRARIGAGLTGAKVDAGLLETLVYLTEHPTAIEGGFDPAFLELPAEVLVTVMRHHQRYFSVEDAEGKLLPRFFAVMNIGADPEGFVRRGNERVLRARFTDARFFWDSDQKKKLAERRKDLAAVTFQAKLGSYRDKAKRMKTLAGELGGKASAVRAADLCKCDLTTELVKEFPELQGVVGGLYARAQGEREDVWQAIYDHYNPVSMEDSIPRNSAGRIVALADKLDTLRGCFRVGLIPTGSRDPFALRRAAQGVVKILVEGGMALPLLDFLEGNAELTAFFQERVKFYFKDARGFQYDEVNAAMAAGWSNLADLAARLTRIQGLRQSPDFEPLAASFKRIRNILEQARYEGAGSIGEDLLQEEPEKELYREYRSIAGQPIESVISRLRPKVDLFFDKVLVNAPREEVRQNRLQLLYELRREFSKVADFSEIVTTS
jgi:glycyl-tRNA synthetase beta chain